MITGLGCDVIELARIQRAVERNGEKFVEKVLSKEEKEEYIRRSKTSSQRALRYLSGRWAAKEAFSKSLGTGFREEVCFEDISVLNDELGAPYIKLQGPLKDRFSHEKCQFLVSLSDSELVTMAVVVYERI